MSPVSSFDQLQSSGTDRTLSGSAPDVGCHRSVNSSKVQNFFFLTGRVQLMLTRRWSESGQSLTALSDTMAGTTNWSVQLAHRVMTQPPNVMF